MGECIAEDLYEIAEKPGVLDLRTIFNRVSRMYAQRCLIAFATSNSAIVAGSFALHHYLEQNSEDKEWPPWDPGDIDIFVHKTTHTGCIGCNEDDDWETWERIVDVTQQL